MAQVSGDHFVITVLATPEAHTALVCLAGEIDLAAVPALSDVADRLAAIEPAEVVVDLAAVTFACSTLPNFLARVHLTLPDSTTLIVCRPTTSTRRVLEITGMEQIMTLRGDLPTSGPWVPRNGAGRVESEDAAPELNLQRSHLADI